MNSMPGPTPTAPPPTIGYHGAVSDFKRRLIEATLHETRGNRTHAARALGLQRTYLLRLIRDLGVAAPPPAARVRAQQEQRGGQEGPPVSPPPRVDLPAASAAYPPRRPPARAFADNG